MTDTVRATEVLGRSRYVLLTTFRRDGTPVPTPVWAAQDGDRLVLVTGAATGKVKRIRRSGRVLVAPCSARGTAKGVGVVAEARLLPDDERRGVTAALTAKYGWQFHVFTAVEAIAERLGRFDPDQVALEVRLAP